ncbi:uncharacterized protein LOC135840692 [Planococcus citri]|uniref:uncharacterized protein LOC135840692 n=1 Tax=Planococcus citri TaxID=170843 RepID=UPI0031F7C6B9
MIAWSVLLLLCQLVALGSGYGEQPPPATPTTPPPQYPPAAPPPPPQYPPAAPPPPPQYPPASPPPPPTTPPPPPPPSATPPPPPATPPPPPPPPATPPPATPTTPTTPPCPPGSTTPTPPTPTTPPPGGKPPSSPTPPPAPYPTPPTGSGSTEIIIPEISIVVKQSMTIYYEAMEEHSQIFFNKTLNDKFSTFYPYIDFSFVPCQQAQIINGDLFCYSPIDPTCTLNKVHSCAIAQTNDRLALAKFLTCTMTGTAALPDYNTCATSSGIDTTKLQACLTSDLAKQLCIAFKSRKAPECGSLPGFIFKNPKDIKPTDPFNHFLNNACSADFVSTTCAVLKSSKKPAPIECNQQKLAVSYSYKIMDENSYKVLQEWAKLYDKFGKFFTMDFQPCMFAEMNNGHLDCKAEADKDCVTGKMHSCAISLVQDEVALFKFIACSAQDHTKLPDFQKCATDNKIDFNLIKGCVDSGKGDRLCYRSGKTRPNTKEMPVVRFEMKYNEAVSKESWTNLQFVLCQEFKYYNLTYPDECKGEEKLSIFYDSLDPEFQCFLSTKFMENYRKFAPFVTFDFVPCRTAKEEGGNLSCPNKLDNKCFVDKFESCTVKNFPDNDLSLKILLCLSQFDGDLFPAHEACVVSAQLDGAKLKDCANGEDGKKLCIDNAKKAPKNDRSMAFQYGDKWDEKIDKDLAGDFPKTLCNLLKDAKKGYPLDCYPEDK